VPLPPAASPELSGRVELVERGPFRAGDWVTMHIAYTVGAVTLVPGSRLRIGLPNTGWSRPRVPHPRYWEEEAGGAVQDYTPFHRVNTSADLGSGIPARVELAVTERMLAPNLDPAHGYWRWWITATVREGHLAPGDRLTVLYGDTRFGEAGARVQTFPEPQINIACYVDLAGDGRYRGVAGAPIYFDVLPGPPVRANVVVPSVVSPPVLAAVALTDECHCLPGRAAVPALYLVGAETQVRLNDSPWPQRVALSVGEAIGGIEVRDETGACWGRSNPASLPGPEGLKLFWGDLHAQSMYHSGHSQRADHHQAEWTKSLSCGTPSEVYEYARDVALLDFAVITDQGACLSRGWEPLQEAANLFNAAGSFVTLRGYEAGVAVGHRNVYLRGSEIEAPHDPGSFSLHPTALYDFYRGRTDVLMIPHHVKVWTDWQFHCPELEPVMEVYSSWGQSEDPSLERWEKGMTPGAGAWEAFRRGYRLGIVASSDTHVGMPGRIYPGSRQWHTPFGGGVCAVWASDLTRESLFDALRGRRCYGTTGARIVLRFSIGSHGMGSEVAGWSPDRPREILAEVIGTDVIEKIEVLRDGSVVHAEYPNAAAASLTWRDDSPLGRTAVYRLRVQQIEGEMAWSSPIWVDAEQE